MPHANPNESFNVAARHMFRHLNDAPALRRNPLVSWAFRGVSVRDSSAAVLSAILSQIVNIGRACYAEDIKANRATRAHRQQAVLKSVCAHGSPEQTARELGISVKQFYRDRRAICVRVAQRLQNIGNRPLSSPGCDIGTLAIRRVASLIDKGFFGRAMTECDRIVADASPPLLPTVPEMDSPDGL
jgi:hypothetical protein